MLAVRLDAVERNATSGMALDVAVLFGGDFQDAFRR
jgi:hypothetical protein